MNFEGRIIMRKNNKKIEALLEAEAREMRRVINFQSAMCSKEKEISDCKERQEKRTMDRRLRRRERNARKVENIHLFLERNLLSLILAGVLCILDFCGLVDFALCFAGVLLIGTYLVVNFCAFVTRNSKTPEKGANVKCAQQ